MISATLKTCSNRKKADVCRNFSRSQTVLLFFYVNFIWNTMSSNGFQAGFIVGPPRPNYKGGIEFLKFSQKGGIQIFPIKGQGLIK